MSLEDLILSGIQPVVAMCAAWEIDSADLTLNLKAPIQSWKSPRVDAILVNNVGPEQCLHDM